MDDKYDKHGWRPIGIKEIDFGRNDGKLDSLERYFLDTGVMERLKSRKSFFILGRKGTGKTALGRQIAEATSGKWNQFSSLLSLRNVPVNLLEEFADKDQAQSSRYVLVWQFVLLLELAKELVKDAALHPDDVKRLETIILATSPTISSSPEVYLKKTSERGYRINAANFSIEGKTVSDGSTVDLLAFTLALKELVFNVARIGNAYRIIIDELDDSYAESRNYFDLIIALFKAASEINFQASEHRKDCTIIVALRDDIFDSINYSDKNKWSDVAIRVNWQPKVTQLANQSDLFKMINLRIGASLVDEPQISGPYWKHFFPDVFVKADLKPFQYILSRTFYRPRDVIQFCKCIQECCAAGAKTADVATISEAELSYSDWLLNEIVDEMHVKLPEVRQVFEVFRQLKQPTFVSREVGGLFSKIGFKDTQDINRVLAILFDFSVIGQFDSETTPPVFRYRNPIRKFETGRKYSVHYGLRATLRLFGSLPKIPSAKWRRR